MTDLAMIKVGVDTREVKQAQSDIKGLGTTAGDVEKKTKESTDGMSRSFGGVSGAVKVLTGVLAAVGIGSLIKGFSDTVMQSEKLKGALTTMTGSTENAAFAFEELTRFASETPFTLDQSVQGFIKLKALGLDPSERALRSYGNTASAMGKDMMQMIEAVADASTGEFERLKEFGIKAKKEGDNVSLTFQGVTRTIGNSSEEIQEYLLAIGEVQFGTAMEDQMKRLPGLLSNLEDNVGNFFRTIGDAGGIKIFGTLIAAASTGVLLLTDNIDIVITVVQAFAASFAVIVGPAAIVAGFSSISKAVMGLNAVILANPIAALVAAAAFAAVVIYKNFDTIKRGAQSAALNIEIAWNELKLFLIEGFAPALTAIAGLFTDVKNRAIATWSAIAAAAQDPLNAIDTFNSTFDKTLKRLQDGERESNTFAGSVATTRGRIEELESELSALNTTTIDTDDAIVDTTRSLSDFAIKSEDAADETDLLNKKALDLLGTLSNEREALTLSSLELAIRNNLQKAGEDATSELGKQIVQATTALHNETEAMKATSDAAKDAEKNATSLGQAAKEAAELAQKNWERTHEYLSSTFVDIFNNGKDAFSKIADSFTAMIQRMVAEWAASKLMNLIGIGSGQGGTSTSLIGSIGSLLTGGGGAGSGAAGNLISGSGGSLLAAGGQFLGGLTGTAVGTGSAIVGPPTAAAAAGAGVGGTIAGIGSTIASGVSAVGSAISGGLSSAGALIMANPLLAAAAVAALAAAALAKKPTLSSNAGLLIHDAPGASADRKFAVDPFDSGFAPIGFARREDHAAANDVIDVFRKYDSSLTEIAKAAGLNVNFSNNPFGGYNEKGQANGLFLGTAAEKGKGVTSAPIADQLTQFTKQWIEALGGQVAASDREFLLSSGSADVLLERAATLGMAEKARIDGSHADGLSMVPFDGYRAELHKGEEVLRADDPRNKNNENTSKLNQLTMQVALYTKRFSQILDDWDVRGLPPVRPT